ncbi:uracil-DNA glycosylase family protein [Curvibacter sp. HBC61]|uniref:Uracil-DNA glycosylase family protein n=1 Tax=Curvibacter cyanobacteriorum TaxID=3026422 RepID=A0ABT5MZ64_9BURK|nr:uracil-DNA glycosylase family protein [Curvibacter sp. HBC61]MDD0839352.1 uracil-DNA glycosylase family protein [Curvibacter sp. HBC61]
MTLNLDARQRAMLDEMHIPFWWPEPPLAGELLAPAGADTGVASASPERAAAQRPAPAADWPASHDTHQVHQAHQAAHAPAAPPVVPRPAPAVAPVDAPQAPAVVRAAPSPAAPLRHDPAQGVADATATPSLWQLHPAQALFNAPAAPGGFLLVTEAVWPGDDPLADGAGPAGQLLHNMLRAMRLHQPARAWLAGLSRRPTGDTPEPLPWHELLQAQRPGLVLLMGRTAAREALGRDEPLGRLRGQVHDLHGVPAIVTYDASYLLRTQADKARAWADLCLALSQPGVALP